MQDEEVQVLVEELSLQFFKRPFLYTASFNKRLKTTGGRYLLQSHNIELNYQMYEEFGMEELVGIIKHELCHYHLHIQGLGYQHRDKDFRELLKVVNAPRFCSTLKKVSTNKKFKIHLYQCIECNLGYRRKRRINTTKYRCGKCSGKLKYVNQIEI